MKISQCRACQGPLSPRFLDLGEMPLANSLPAQIDAPPDARFPLALCRCLNCSLVQIDETVPPEAMFSDYLYFSSFSDTMVQHARHLVQRSIAEQGLNSDSFAMEIASNDGYLLQFYVQAGIPALGIEPAQNVAEVARNQRQVPTHCGFFGRELAENYQGQVDVLHANNVLAHVPDLPGFVAGIRRVLKDEGMAWIEVPSLLEFLDGLSFDTIYHEHLSYFSLTALNRLFHAQDLTIVDVERIPLHGGSLLIQARPGQRPAGARVQALLQEERERGVEGAALYADYSSKVQTVIQQLQTCLNDYKNAGARLAAYGAAAKGAILLNAAGVAPLLDYVADRSPYKQGRYMPGVRLPIVSPEHLLSDPPDVVLLLTWNFAAEILEQQAEYRRRGGKFVIPVPQLRVL